MANVVDMQNVLIKCAGCSDIFDSIPMFQGHSCNADSPNQPRSRPYGPISDLVPVKYHRHIRRDVLKSHVCNSEGEADELRKRISPADIPVIVFDSSKPIFTKVRQTLNEQGKVAVEEMAQTPWLINLLVDWCQFDIFICNMETEGHTRDVHVSEAAMHTLPMPLVSVPLKWSKVAVTTLIELYKKHEAKFSKPSTKKKMVWQIFAQQLNERGFNFNASQCEQKWKKLTKAYRDCIDHNKRSGNYRKECPFFKDLEECYGYKPNVRPVFTLGTGSTSTGNGEPAHTTGASAATDDESNTRGCSSSTPDSPLKLKNKRPRGPVSLTCIFKQ